MIIRLFNFGIVLCAETGGCSVITAMVIPIKERKILPLLNASVQLDKFK